MEGAAVEREYSALGNLFQQIIADMKNGTPIWEDFIAKASKLHTVLKSALTAVAAYLDAFQKIADAATGARGATKEIGTALTRMCLRHKAMETRMKAFTCAIMDCLVNPLQEKLEDWKKTLINIDKDHSREYKRARSELKKRSTDTLRLQKKARKGKGGDLQRRVETCMQDVNERRQILEDAEKKAVRAALVEERSRFCLFVALLKPVVDSEVAMLAEVSHLQEGAGQLMRHTTEPHSLPAASEQVISDLQALHGGGGWSPPPSPPSPRALGRASLCSSVSSLASSSSGSAPALQPGTDAAPRLNNNNLPVRLGSVSSRDSGFTSQDTLHLPPLIEFRVKHSDNTSAASSCSTPVGDVGDRGEGGPSLPGDSATWPDLQDTMQFERAATAIMSDRPHTISTAYEKGHSRPALSVHTFSAHGGSEVNVGGSASQPVSPCYPSPTASRPAYARPPLPTRCSSLERPVLPAKSTPGILLSLPEHKLAKPSSLPPHLIKDTPQATYVNMFELANMAASRAQGQHAAGDHAHNTHEKACESSTSESSLESSSGYGSQGACPIEDSAQLQYSMDEPPRLAADRLAVEDMSVSLSSLQGEDAGATASSPPAAFATISRAKPSVPKRRPLSMTATCPPAGMRLGGAGAGGTGRRGSAGAPRPPPPVRRSSSISRPHGHPGQEYGSSQQLNIVMCEGEDNLPPPPAFLLNPSDQHADATPRCSTPNAQHGKGINVAETVKALTELKHTPASPSLLRRNTLTNTNTQPPTPSAAPMSSFQQSKSTFTNLQHSNLNPIYGPAGHKMYTYAAEQNNSLYGSRNSSFTNLSANSGIYSKDISSHVGGDSYDGIQPNRMNSSSYSATVTYSSSPNSSNYAENSMSTFGQRNQSGSTTPSTPIYGQTTFGKQPGNMNQSYEKKNPFAAVTPGGNSIYAQPSQIIAGFNNLGFGGNRNHDGNMSPMSVRKNVTTPRSQSADRRGSDFGGGLIAAISARLAPQLSPRHARRSISSEAESCGMPLAHLRSSQDSLACFQNNQKQYSKNSQGVATVQPAFLDKLSATLRQRQSTPSGVNRATSIRHIINTKAQPDPRVCHGSLMEQIKRGANLKRNKHCNDRSAPKIH